MPLYPNPSDKDKNVQTAKFEVEYEEVFHLKELYKRCFEWFMLWNYTDLEGGNVPETLYLEVINQAGAQNHHIWWRWQKVINKYVKYFIKFDIQTLNSKSVEIMHKGKKAKTNKTDVIFRVEGWVMLDYEDQWKGHWLLKYVDRRFSKRWFRQEKEAHKKQLWFEVYNLEDSIKQYLELHGPAERPEPFHPNKGLL